MEDPKSLIEILGKSLFETDVNLCFSYKNYACTSMIDAGYRILKPAIALKSRLDDEIHVLAVSISRNTQRLANYYQLDNSF